MTVFVIVILIELLEHYTYIPSCYSSLALNELISIVRGRRRHPSQGLLQPMCTNLEHRPLQGLEIQRLQINTTVLFQAIH
jgi:hypothetical protein